jgi:Ser/Thr protein kinase RdoA (MazF antagonist)
MMKLKNMVRNTNSIAEEFLENWNYDKNSLMFWRASSNYIYVFRYNREKYFLRFVLEEDNTINQICGEIEFINYLHENKYPCAYPILSKNSKFIERVLSDSGSYYGVVFTEAKGSRLHIENMNENQFEAWGRALGELHSLSSRYNPINNFRRSHKEVLEYIRNILIEYPEEKLALGEQERVKRWFNALPITKVNYGLIHYDFELDNIFWKENSSSLCVIDFDDTLYHWHVMDIVYAIRDFNDLSEEGAKLAFNSFIKGYNKVMYIGAYELSLMPRFERFSNLYSFARIKRAMKDSNIENQPEWFIRLRLYLEKKCSDYREGFNKPW